MARKNEAPGIARPIAAALAVSWALAMTVVPASAQTRVPIPAETKLPPDATRDFQSGLSAAQAQHWDEAIRHFEAAQHKALAFPPLLLNLGLTEEAAGNRLAAIYWLRAFLLTAPDASNGEDVRLEVKKLLGQVETNVRDILNAARSITAEFPDGKDKAETNARIDEKYAFFYATARHDIEAGLRLLPGRSSDIWSAYGRYSAGIGDFDEAIAAIPHVDGQGRDREELVAVIANALQASGKEALVQDVLKRVEEGAALEWRARQALDRDDPVEAKRLAGMIQTSGGSVEKPDESLAMRNLLRTEALYGDLATYYLNDFRNPARQDQARAAMRWLTSWEHSNEIVRLTMSYLDVGAGSAARGLAEEANSSALHLEDGLNIPEVFLSLVLGNKEKLENNGVAHLPQYFAGFIMYDVATGRVDEARRVVAAAPHDLRPDLRESWTAQQIGAEQLNYALWSRMIDLLSLDDIRPAKKFLSEFPQTRCDADTLSVDRELRPLALSHVAQWEIDHHDLTGAAAAIASMPEGNPLAFLTAQCVVYKTEKMERLAEAYLEAGRREPASELIPKVATLIWRGALSGPIIERLAKLQDALSDPEGAAATRRLAKYSALAFVVLDAHYHSHNQVSADVAGRVAAITSRMKSGSAGKREDAREMVTQLLDLAESLRISLVVYEWTLKDARDAGNRGR